MDVLAIAVFLIVVMFSFLLVGKYSFFEKVLVVFVTLMGLSFILSMFMVLPSPAEIARGFIPSIPPGGNLMVAATGALFHEGKIVTKVLDMVYALEPVAGKFAVAIFMFGAMSAGLSSIFPILMVLPLLIGDYKQGKMDVKSSTFKILAATACIVGLTVPVLGVNPIMAQIALETLNRAMT